MANRPTRQVIIDPNIGLPSLDAHRDEPSGVLYTIRKSIRGLWASRETEDVATNRDLYVRTTLRELFVYLLFLSTTLVITFTSTSSSRYQLTAAMGNVFLATDPSFDGIVTMAQMFNYMKGPLLDGLFWDTWYNTRAVNEDGQDPNYVYYANKVLGLARIRQLRVQNGSCEIPEQFRDVIFNCFGDYSIETEETNAFGPKLPASAWHYQNASVTGGTPHWGKMATYEAGGYIQDLATDKATSLTLLEALYQNRWIDRATRAILIDFALFNPNLNLFATVRLVAEFPSTGGVVTSHEIHVSKFIRYLSNDDYMVLVFEIIFCLFILYYSGEEFLEISKLKWSYFFSVWNFLDVAVLVASTCCVVFSVYRDKVMVADLPDMVARKTEFSDYHYLSNFQVNLDNARAIIVFFAWLKVFKYLSFNKTMMQLSDTLSKAARDLGSFSIMFFIVFFAFVQLGYLLFGTQLKGFADIGTASFTLLRTLLCDFDFESYQSANRVLGPLFFFLYAFFVYFCLMNMFLAIINECYANVKTDLSEKRTEFHIAEYVKKAIDRIVKTLHIRKLEKKKTAGKTVVQQVINKHRAEKELIHWKDDLKARGYTDEEIVTVFGASSTPKEEDETSAKEDTGGGEGGGDGGGDNQAVSSVDPAEFAAMKAKLARIEACLKAILDNLDTTLLKMDVMEKAKQYRSNTLDVLIDKLDGGEYSKEKRKSDLTKAELQKSDLVSEVDRKKSDPQPAERKRSKPRPSQGKETNNKTSETKL